MSTAWSDSLPFGRFLSVAARQTLFLFIIDGFANVVDYLFHAYLGRALTPGGFAVVQTMNAVFLIVGTAFAVLQPVVARRTATSRSLGEPPARRAAVFRLYFTQSAVIGALLAAITWLGREALAGWLNVPAAAVSLGAIMVIFFLLRPVVNGMLQGEERFTPFGLTHGAYALGRLGLALLLVGALGGGAVAAVAAMPGGAALALLTGLLFLGPLVTQRQAGDPPAGREILWEGWRLSLAAFVAYAAYMSLLNLDLIWVNRVFPPDPAGSYASAAVLRRVMSVLPGAVLVVFYPRVVAHVAQGRRPDRTLLKAMAVILTSTAALTLVYFRLGPELVRLIFGEQYLPAAGLIGWMGLGMIGYGLTAVWMNLFLASRPWPFVALLALTAAVQAALLARPVATLGQATAVFVLTGWAAALGGAVLYLVWLRPRLGDN